jgi:Cft2 family RNA processing exonuclease
VPVICTLPVLKMGQMTLYDCICNLENEFKENRSLLFTYDDIDSCLDAAHTVRYSQPVTIPSNHANLHALTTSVTAYPSGRTIGGSIWHIRCGAADVLYAMDINLKKDVILDGGSLDLPVSPSLLIVEGGCASAARNVGAASVSRRKRVGGAVAGSGTGEILKGFNCEMK